RIALAIGHIGDLLRRWREPRGQHELVAAGEIAHIGAILIHDRKPLHPPFRRTGLVDKYHAAVEIAAFAGEPFVNSVGDDMSDAPPIVGRGEILLTVELLSAEHVPQPEFRLQAPVSLPPDAA